MRTLPARLGCRGEVGFPLAGHLAMRLAVAHDRPTIRDALRREHHASLAALTSLPPDDCQGVTLLTCYQEGLALPALICPRGQQTVTAKKHH